MDIQLLYLIALLDRQLEAFDVEIEGGTASVVEDVLEQLAEEWDEEEIGVPYRLPDSIDYDCGSKLGLNLILKWEQPYDIEVEVMVGVRDEDIKALTEHILRNIPE